MNGLPGLARNAPAAGRTGTRLRHRLWFVGIAALLFTRQTPATDAFEPSIEGRWLTDDRSAVVTIAHCGELFCGSITKVLNTAPNVPRTDIRNPEAGLRTRPILGLPVLTGFRREGRRWTGGRAYDPKSGNSYRSVLELSGEGSLKVTGCVLLFCQSKLWTRQP